MKTEVQLTSKQITIEDLKCSDHIGIVIDEFGKHYIVSININEYTCICIDGGDPENTSGCNVYAEGVKKTLIEKVKDVIDSCNVTHIYRFDTRKELYQWLVED